MFTEAGFVPTRSGGSHYEAKLEVEEQQPTSGQTPPKDTKPKAIKVRDEHGGGGSSHETLFAQYHFAMGRLQAHLALGVCQVASFGHTAVSGRPSDPPPLVALTTPSDQVCARAAELGPNVARQARALAMKISWSSFVAQHAPAMRTTEDGALVLEWFAGKRSIGVILDEHEAESGWCIVDDPLHGGTAEYGSLDTFDAARAIVLLTK